MQALVLKNVSKSFGGIHSVREVDFVVNAGERRALIGPNGAGKTTLYNLITGELRLDTGEIRLFGQDLTHEPVQKRIQLGMGRTYQTSNLFWELTVQENLFLAAWKREKPSPSLWSTVFRSWNTFDSQCGRAWEIAQQVHLEKKFDVPVNELSHGEYRQLELGITLAHDPKILLLDEPMAGLSTNERTFMTELIMKLEPEITVVIIEHDINIAFSIADRVSVLHRGSIIAEGSPAEVQANQQVQEIYILHHRSHEENHV